MKFLSDNKEGIRDIPDNMLDIIRTETEKTSSKHIQHSEARKVASEAIIGRILEFYDILFNQYAASLKNIETYKNDYVNKVKTFNGEKSPKKTMYAKLNSKYQSTLKKVNALEQGPESLDKYYSKVIKIAAALFENGIFRRAFRMRLIN